MLKFSSGTSASKVRVVLIVDVVFVFVVVVDFVDVIFVAVVV